MTAAREPAASSSSAVEVSAAVRRLCERLYSRARADRWQLPQESFQQALHRSVTHHFRGAHPATAEIERYVTGLHLEDLALACACAEGNEAAWEHFVREFRPVLYSAARAIGGESGSRDLADSLYAELFGVDSNADSGQRRSLFDYFHGRSKLSTWLRAVLSQRHVDRLRASRRLESLDETESGEAGEGRFLGREVTASAEPLPDPDRPRYLALLQAALRQALAALGPRDRLRLCYYYVQDLTLAQIGRLLGEHEATVSRKLDRVRRELRQQIEDTLCDPGGAARLSEAQVRLCFEYALEEWPFDLTRALSEGETQQEGTSKP